MNTSPELHRIILDGNGDWEKAIYLRSRDSSIFCSSPDHVMSLNPDDGDEYKKALNFLQKAIYHLKVLESLQ